MHRTHSLKNIFCLENYLYISTHSFRFDKIEITFDPNFISKIVGVDISKEFIVKTLKALEFGVEEDGENLKVSVPSFRATKDVSIKEDLVEEVARLYGYDNIVPAPLAFDTVPQELIKSIEYEYLTNNSPIKPSTSDSNWDIAMETPTENNRYLWQKESLYDKSIQC